MSTAPSAPSVAFSSSADAISVSDLPVLDQSIPPWPGRAVQLGGTTLYVRSTPFTGPADRVPEPALFVHGLGGDATNWTDLTAQLSPWLASEAIELPGFGNSGPASDNDYSISAMMATVITYLENSGRGPVHLFGNSMGGLISILVAATRPDLVRTLTLVSPAVPDLRPTRIRINPLPVLLVPGLGRILLRQMANASAANRARETIKMCYGDPTRVPAHRFDEAVAQVIQRGSMPWVSDALLRSLRGLVGSYLIPGSQGVWARMRAITAPTLVLWGDKDKLVDVALAPRVAREIPGARLIIYPGIGHVTQMEDPQAAALAFLRLRADAGIG